MRVVLNDLYLAQGDAIKKRMKKGEHVEISFTNIRALGGSFVQDLKDWVHLPNVQLVDVADFVKGQLAEQLGVKLDEPDFDQMSLF